MSLWLSVCIPVYNCADFLGQALDSILPQTNTEVEVIVYDGGSTDATTELMAGYARTWNNLHYHRGNSRGGIDADLATCVGFAQGEYCWLFSGDDVMRPGAITKIREWLKPNDDICICKHTICNKEMVISHEYSVLNPDREFSANLANPEERQEWFRRAVTTEAFFSFLSGLIVRREKWQYGFLTQQFDGSCWGHVARFFGLIPAGLIVRYVPQTLLDQRGENDSFADRGMVNRYGIAIEGYNRLADSFFGHDTAEAFHVRRVIRNEFTLPILLDAKMKCLTGAKPQDKELLERLVRMAYCNDGLSVVIQRYLYIASPLWLLTFVKIARRLIKKTRWPYRDA